MLANARGEGASTFERPRRRNDYDILSTLPLRAFIRAGCAGYRGRSDVSCSGALAAEAEKRSGVARRIFLYAAWIELRILPFAPFRVGCLIPLVAVLGLPARALVLALLLLIGIAGIRLAIPMFTHGSLQARSKLPVRKHSPPQLIAERPDTAAVV